MSIQYKFRKLPPTADANGAVAPRLYPIAVKTRTIRFDEMAADVSEACSFSPADLKGIIQAIADVTARYLNDGCHIEFEHFGTLSLGIACERDDEGYLPVITSPTQVKPGQLHVEKLYFDAKPEFLSRLQGPFVHAQAASAVDAVPTLAARRALLLDHLATYGVISISTYMTLTHLTRNRANAELHAFAAQGLLRLSGIPPHLSFVKA